MSKLDGRSWLETRKDARNEISKVHPGQEKTRWKTACFGGRELRILSGALGVLASMKET